MPKPETADVAKITEHAGVDVERLRALLAP
jgi:hypothetical protein